jgi:hypothetical protein
VTAPRAARALAGTAATLLAAAAAHGGAHVELARCPTLDGPALERAIAVELPAAPADRELAVVVTCPDATTADLHVVPAPAGGPLRRTVDLADLAEPLRIRLVALAVAELMRTALDLGAAGAGAPTAPIDVRVAAPPSDVPDNDAALHRRLPVRPAGHPMQLAARLGLRTYPQLAVPMTNLELEAVRGAVSVGVVAAIGEREVELGTLRPGLAAATLGIALVCVAGTIEWCARLRAQAGIAIVGGSAARPDTVTSTAVAGYAQLGAQLEAAWPIGAVALLGAVDAGWAEGLIGSAGDEDGVRLDGAVISAGVGVRW